MERNRRRGTRLAGAARRLFFFAVLCTASSCWFAAGAAQADTPPSIDGNQPSISGTPREGNSLTADPGDWVGDAPITFDYAWSDGKSAQTITLTAGDVGQSLTVTVTARNDFGDVPATSDSDGPVLPLFPPGPGNPPPVISGTPQQGATLTVSNGTWSNNPTDFGYVWEDCDGSGNNCVAIVGATSSSYTLQDSDVDNTIVAVVTATNDGGSGSASSAAAGPVIPAAPEPGNPPPVISGGTPQQGKALSVSNGTWSNNPTSFGYAWEDCDASGNNCVAIPGAVSKSYTPQATDVSHTVVAQVTALNAGGANATTSASVGPVIPAAPGPANPPPVISGGTPQQGKALSVTTGSWSNNPTSFSYAWEDCDGTGTSCSPIPGATSSSYTPQASDVNQSVVAQVTATNGGGANAATSAAVGPVLPAAPASGQPLPGITGTVQQGHTLTASIGAWSNNPTGFTYVWEDCDATGSNCTAIPAATASTYVLQATDVGSRIVVVVTAINGGGRNSASSAPTAAVLIAAPTIATAPGISGTPQQGKTLSVGTGTWNNSPASFTYAWQDCGATGSPCSPISGATSSSYAVQASDVKQYVSVAVTAVNAGGRTQVFAASVGPVLPPPPVNTGPPVISGKGGTLSVGNTTWNNGPVTLSYAWQSCNGSGPSCTAIPGATSSSYALSGADIGTTLFCAVTATGPGGTTSVNTAKTGVVLASQIAPASQPTTTVLLATPSAPVTNQNVTLIATVTAGTSSTALWGTVTFKNGGSAIGGCADMPAVPSGRSATVACSTAFAASTAQLTAVFTPASGSILQSSASPGTGLTIGHDSSSTSLAAPSSVIVGASATYTARVTPPAARPGPVQPIGSVQFLDGGQPISSCASLSLTGGAASCTVSYAAAGTHQITVSYSGDGNFSGSASPVQQVSVAAPTPTVLGTITSTMQWAFHFTPKYTVVRTLVVNGLLPGARVVVKCQGPGCPFANRATLLTQGKRCGRKAKRSCPARGTLNLTPSFVGRHLKIGARITISIVRPNWVGKSYRFTIRARSAPRVQIGALPVL